MILDDLDNLLSDSDLIKLIMGRTVIHSLILPSTDSQQLTPGQNKAVDKANVVNRLLLVCFRSSSIQPVLYSLLACQFLLIASFKISLPGPFKVSLFPSRDLKSYKILVILVIQVTRLSRQFANSNNPP